MCGTEGARIITGLNDNQLCQALNARFYTARSFFEVTFTPLYHTLSVPNQIQYPTFQDSNLVLKFPCGECGLPIHQTQDIVFD